MRQLAKETMLLTVGSILYVLSTILISPVRIIPGSVLGISIIVHSLWKIPVGMTNVVCNIPIMFFCTRCFGRKTLLYTILIIVATSVFIDWYAPIFSVMLAENGLAIAIIGGILMGVGAGLLMRAGGTMGGTTAISKILQRKWVDMDMGMGLFIMDSVIIVSGAIFFKSISSLSYSIIYTLVCSKLIGWIYLGRR